MLITGASGLLGSTLLAQAALRGEDAVGVWHSNEVHGHGSVRATACDLTHPSRVVELVSRLKPTRVVHCASWTDVDACEGDPERAFILNAVVARTVAAAASRAGARLVHISTDAVFSGSQGGHVESDEPRPLSVYGRTKLAGELAVLDEAPSALVLRTAIYGWGPPWRRSLAEWVLARLGEGTPVPGFTDVFFTPILCNDLGTAIGDLLTNGREGLVHVAGADRVSKFDFARAVARAFDFDEDLVQAARSSDVDFSVARAGDLSLDTTLAENYGVAIPRVDAGLLRFRALMDGPFRTSLDALTSP
jgi:dTDP-4-dehydrorhamnose reductase